MDTNHGPGRAIKKEKKKEERLLGEKRISKSIRGQRKNQREKKASAGDRALKQVEPRKKEGSALRIRVE